MSLFDSLPSLGNAVGGAVNYAMASTSTLISEAVSKVGSTVGGVIGGALGPFASLVSGGAKAVKPPQLEGTATATAMKASGVGASADEINTYHKVKLVASVADGSSMAIQNDPAFPHEALMQRVVEFDTMPEISENRNAEYEALAAPQMPGEFQKFKGTKSTAWTISAMLTCRTKDEATRNYVYMNNLRGWVMPYFGERQRVQFGDGAKLGAPPPVLKFSGWRGIVGEVPVVVTQLSWNWPKDCDWIPTHIPDDKNGQPIPFPTVMNVTINLVESFSPSQINAFDLESFRNGRMLNAFSVNQVTLPSPSVAEPVGGNQTTVAGIPSPTADELAGLGAVDNLSEAQLNTFTVADWAGEGVPSVPTANPDAIDSAQPSRNELVDELENLKAQKNGYDEAIQIGRTQYANNPSNELQLTIIGQIQRRDAIAGQIRNLQNQLDKLG